MYISNGETEASKILSLEIFHRSSVNALTSRSSVSIPRLSRAHGISFALIVCALCKHCFHDATYDYKQHLLNT